LKSGMLPRSGYSKQAEGLASGFSISRVSGLKPGSGQDYWHAAPYPDAERISGAVDGSLSRWSAQCRRSIGGGIVDLRVFPRGSPPLTGRGVPRTRGRRTPQQLFDNWLENMLKTCQDRLVRTVHGPPEGVFFLFPADFLELTNRARREGAD
jgi:hypothetical protein